jgi:hypothetical protein
VCRRVKCHICGKTTWAGCGMHVEQVMASVPASQRCPGHSDDATAKRGGLVSRLLGHRGK